MNDFFAVSINNLKDKKCNIYGPIFQMKNNLTNDKYIMGKKFQRNYLSRMLVLSTY